MFTNRVFHNGSITAPITSSLGQSEALKALSKSHRYLPEGNPTVISDILNNPEKSSLDDQGFPVRPMKMDIGFGFCRSKCTG